jgi:hypothetical protein
LEMLSAMIVAQHCPEEEGGVTTNQSNMEK